MRAVRRLFASLSAAACGVMQIQAAAQPVNPYVEVEATTAGIPDFEWDWGALSGTPCPTCNQGFGNMRITFTDSEGNLWVAGIDYNTGLFIPEDARGELLDTNCAPVPDFGNGSEWIFSKTYGSQVIYIKYLDGLPHSIDTATVAIKTQTADGTWVGGTIPGGVARATGIGTRNINDTDPQINYIQSDKTAMYWRKLSEIGVEHLIPAPVGTNGNARRWIPGTHKIIFTAPPPGSTNGLFEQAFIYDTDTNQLEQLTNVTHGLVGTYPFIAPEFHNELLFVSAPNGRQVLFIYRRLPGADGTMRWTIIKTIRPPAQLPYFFSPAAFSYNGHSYVVFQLSPSAQFYDKTIPTHIGFASVDPLVGDGVRVVTANGPPRLRLDPKKVFISAKGPLVYYNRAIPQTDAHPAVNDGTWYVDLLLGPPQP
jgi:hypothetical protein